MVSNSPDSWAQLNPYRLERPSFWDKVRPLLWQERLPIIGPLPRAMDSQGHGYWQLDARRITPEQFDCLLHQVRQQYPQLSREQACLMIKRMEIGSDAIDLIEIGSNDLQKLLHCMGTAPAASTISCATEKSSFVPPTPSTSPESVASNRWQQWLSWLGSTLRFAPFIRSRREYELDHT